MTDEPAQRPDSHPELPVDGDPQRTDVEGRALATRPRPAHLRPGLIGLVFVGGAVGTLARWAVGVGAPHVLQVPLGTVAVNVVGAFVLGLLLETLGRGGPDAGVRRRLRVTLGTGFCGGFTTYSALALETGGLLRAGLTGPAVAYALGTLVLGLLAAVAGITVAARTGRAAR